MGSCPTRPRTYPLADVLPCLGPLPPLESTPISTPVVHNLAVGERRRQAHAWLEQHAPAIQGDGGDQHTYNTCCSVVIGYDLTVDEACAVLRDWNTRCEPPWSDVELRAKVSNAERYGEQTRGNRLRRTRDRPVEDLTAFCARIDSQPPLSWHIEGLIPDEGICLWHGQPRAFKSLAMLEAALALASGRAAFAIPRFAVRRPVRVAWFGEEDPERLFAARVHWLTQQHPMPQSGMFFPFIRWSLNFDVLEDREFMFRTLHEAKPDVVVFDPTRSFTGLADKGPAELRPVVLHLRAIQNTTSAKTLMLIAHDVKPPLNGEDTRARSQQASGGGIFSISDCPVAFTKLDWDKVAAFPEDDKLSGNPQPFEITFNTDMRTGPDGSPRFGSWVRAVAVTKGEEAITDDANGQKILQALFAEHPGEWFTAPEIDSQARLRKDTARGVLKRLLEEGLVQHCTGEAAVALNRSAKAQLFAAVSGATLLDNDVNCLRGPGYPPGG